MIRCNKLLISFIIIVIIGMAVVIHFGTVKIPKLNDGVDRRVSSLFIDDYEQQNKNWLFGNGNEPVIGETIMSELGNATIKAELGRSSWRLIHTMAARFPVKPSKDEQDALKQFIYLFSRLYPCGDCAKHFQGVLVNHPPRVDSRENASQWACEVHNVVNNRLHKPQFNCSTVLDHWKCGCDNVKD